MLTVPLVLLPGTLCDAKVFEPMLARLSGVRARVLLTVTATSMRDAAEQVLAQAPEQFALLGFSLGGMVAMEVAVTAPSRVQGLALLNTSPRPVPLARHADRRASLGEVEAMGMADFVQHRLWPEYRSSARPADAALLPLLQGMACTLGPQVYRAQTELALSREEFGSRLGRFRKPALVLGGDEDRLCPPEVQKELHAALPGSRLVLLPQGGHFALLERADEVAAAVAAWFHTVQQAASRASSHARSRTESQERV